MRLDWVQHVSRIRGMQLLQKARCASCTLHLQVEVSEHASSSTLLKQLGRPFSHAHQLQLNVMIDS
jgi:hypothetical protein